MSKHMTVKQVNRLTAIDLAGKGVGQEVQELIRRLESGGVAGSSTSKKKAVQGKGPDADLRTQQAKLLWDKRFGKTLGYNMFEAYLETIPEPPERPTDLPDYLDKLILVDARIACTKDEDGKSFKFGGLVKVCELLGVIFNGNNSTFEPHTPEHVREEDVYWMWCQDGKRNLGKNVQTCRKEFEKNEIGLDAMQGLALFAQNRKVLQDHYVDLPSSVHCGSRGYFAYLGLWLGGPGLSWHWGGSAGSRYGSASCRKCIK